ncbi:MAG: phosphoenolpyruvate--protein phosphotransferase [Anaerolineae bacterium]|nr:phosphoenolpyruvate--protein phosphotransferase [Anaerolineae bacterium]
MIGLVVVSHSRALAEGVAELAREMGGGMVNIAPAGGLDDPPGAIGTDATKVLAAIEQVYSEDGVVVLMDLGSAVLSAEMALAFLGEDRRARVRLCDAPLVEGAIAAAAQARIGATLEQVLAEAYAAGRSPKLTTQASQPEPASPLPPQPVSGEHTMTLTLTNRLGLHIRPAARLVQALTGLDAEVTVRNLSAPGSKPASARSLNALLSLSARRGHTLSVSATGRDAQAALQAIQALAAQNFGDADETAEPAVNAAQQEAPPGSIRGLPVSPGIAVGVLRWLGLSPETLHAPVSDSVDAERNRFRAAVQRTRDQLDTLRRRTAAQAGEHAAAIFAGQLALLSDEAFITRVEHALESGQPAPQAVREALEALATQLEGASDELTRARAADLRDVARQVLRQLAPAAPIEQSSDEAAVVLAAEEFLPSDLAQLWDNVVGLCAARGGLTGHAAILARAMGLPAVFGVGEALSRLSDGALVVLNGDAGFVLPEPEPSYAEQCRSQMAAAQRKRDAARAQSQRAALTRSGKRVEVAANVGSLEDIHRALQNGAEGIGLFRTELLFMDHDAPPSEEAHYAAYRAAAELVGGRTLVIRTLDIGADKLPRWLDLPREDNPFLGLRGLRLCLQRLDLLLPQLRALARVAREFPLHVMFPMVSTLEEWRAARAHWQAAAEPLGAQAKLGIMVETPAAALQAEAFAPEVDFFSVGTNDLVQYVFAVDRGNPAVAHIGNPLHPTVLLLIERVCAAAHAHGRWVGVCGEVASDPQAAAALLACGVDELSMSAPAIPLVKAAIRDL